MVGPIDNANRQSIARTFTEIRATRLLWHHVHPLTLQLLLSRLYKRALLPTKIRVQSYRFIQVYEL